MLNCTCLKVKSQDLLSAAWQLTSEASAHGMDSENGNHQVAQP